MRRGVLGKSRPALVVSPDDLNAVLPRVIIAPLTSRGQPLGCQPTVEFDGRAARILLNQIRTVDKRRLISKMGGIDKQLWHSVLMEMLS